MQLKLVFWILRILIRSAKNLHAWCSIGSAKCIVFLGHPRNYRVWLILIDTAACPMVPLMVSADADFACMAKWQMRDVIPP
jgi:hypothetical protein